jgi:hypothetical protein
VFGSPYICEQAFSLTVLKKKHNSVEPFTEENLLTIIRLATTSTIPDVKRLAAVVLQ